MCCIWLPYGARRTLFQNPIQRAGLVNCLSIRLGVIRYLVVGTRGVKWLGSIDISFRRFIDNVLFECTVVLQSEWQIFIIFTTKGIVNYRLNLIQFSG